MPFKSPCADMLPRQPQSKSTNSELDTNSNNSSQPLPVLLLFSDLAVNHPFGAHLLNPVNAE